MAGSGSGESVAAPGSGSRSGELVAAAASGEGQVHLLRSLDYPCTRRLRLRRLFAYHRRYSGEAIYNLMKEDTRVFFHLKDFIKLVKIGQWRKAAYYLMGFFPLFSGPTSPEARLLMSFHKFLMSLDDFADGKVMVTCLISDWILEIYREPVLVKYPYLANLVYDVLFLRSDHASASLNWLAVRKKAAQMTGDLVRDTPELRDKLHLPCCPKDLYHLVPIRSSFCRHQAKDVRVKQPALALAQFILQTQKRLASSHTFSGYEMGSGEKLMELLDKALKAGSSPIIEQGDTHGHFNNECFPLVQMLSKPPFNNKIPEIKGITLAPDVPASRSLLFSAAMNQKLKDAGHPENNSKRPQASGRFGKDFMKLVKIGLCLKAASYLMGFFPSDPISPEAKLLIFFYKFLVSLNDFANGKVMATCFISDWILDIYKEPVLLKYPYFANLVADVLFLRLDHASASLDWPAVRKKAAEMMGDMVRETPELREKLDPPRGPKDLYHVVPIQSSFGRHRAKNVHIKQPARALVQFFLRMKKRLPSSESQGASHTFSGSEMISSERLMELLDKALKAGSRTIIEQYHIPEHFNECFPLVQMLSKPPIRNKILEIEAMKRKLEDAGHPGNNLKRQKNIHKLHQDLMHTLRHTEKKVRKVEARLPCNVLERLARLNLFDHFIAPGAQDS
ncbi:hypothetical protein EJB05_29828 [Eragrostis curvula]|uniref:Uncharacterized protein n=1 Tax=Eragrostis curvula TaxID=38414 RepID=A0A5J9UV92_9POAL|nr:hypothetical protein EJB05_29828 [Eragrostis curvula]